jgi:HK97 family phage major capsid protein
MKETKSVVATAETRAALHEMMTTFEAYKAMNDARLTAIEGQRPDPLYDQTLARMDTAIDSAQAKAERALAAAQRPSRGGDETKSAADRSPRGEAFGRYLRTGLETGLELKGVAEDLTTTGGGWIAPPEVEHSITLRIRHSSPMRDICSVQTVSSAIYRKVFSIQGAASGWAAETAPRLETAPPVLTNLDVPCFDLYAVPAASQSLLNDALVDIEAWLAMECEDAFALQETQAFITGSGVTQPKGLLASPVAADSASLPWGTLGYIPSGAAGTITTLDPIMDLTYAPRVQFRPNARFILNKKTTALLRKIKDSVGDYIWQPPVQAGGPASLVGYPVTEVETMPDPAANSLSIAFGDFAKGYLIVDRAGINVLRDPYLSKPNVLFYTTKRVGGAVQTADAIKLLKFAAS